MGSYQFFAAALLTLSFANALTLKVCAMRLDHRTAPVFIGTFTLLGLLVTSPFFGHLAVASVTGYRQAPLYLALTLAKGILLWWFFYQSQQLNHGSMSARSFAPITALGLIAITNQFFGEALSPVEWTAALGLCLTGLVFFCRGHLRELSPHYRKKFLVVVGIGTVLGSLDHIIISHSNWYALLLVSNVVMLLYAASHKANRAVWKKAVSGGHALLAGMVFATMELTKFYQQVTIVPVSVVIAVQVSAIPLALLAGSLVWKERSWREQLAWGTISMVFMGLLLFGK